MIKWMPVLFLFVYATISAIINRDVSASIYMSAAVICFYLGRLR